MSNRNFDSSSIIQRLKDQNTAQGLYRAQQAGVTLISNPQTTDPSPQRILSYKEGVETTYSRTLEGGTVISPSGILNLVTK
jgi:hypothetical protein